MDTKEEICKFTGKTYDCKNCAGFKEDWTGRGAFSCHVCQSVVGPLLHYSQRDWQKMARFIKKKDGGIFTANELKEKFLELYADGVEVIKIGDCDNFCYKTGCQGHQEGDGSL